MSGTKAGNAKNNKMIIEAIDALRNRKARPDETRICHWIERRYGMKKEEAVRAIQESVADGSVLRVKYKDSISYRNPAKFTRFVHSHVSKFTAPLNVTKRILRVLRQLTRTESSVKVGASVSDILTALHSNRQLLNYNQAHLERILKRSAQGGTITHLPNGNYVLAGAKRIVVRKPVAQKQNPPASKIDLEIAPQVISQSEKKNATTSATDIVAPKRRDSDTSQPNSESSRGRRKAVPLVARARPVSKRKKFKKSLGPDFLESSDLGLQYLQDSFEPKCDYCQLTSFNPNGPPEELLVCKDCDAKAHPTCMKYSEELAARSRRSPWQCMECKTCVVCEDSGEWNYMLFCDLCDKGYHMKCHEPPLEGKPNGKWVCSRCQSLSKEIKTESVSVDDKASTSTASTDLGESAFGDEEVVAKKTEFSHPENRQELLNNDQPLPLSANLVEIYPNITSTPQNWSVEDVEMFVRFIGFPDQAAIFKEQEIDGISLLLLKRMDVLTGLSLKLGPALKIYGHVKRLQGTHSQQEEN